MPSQPPLPFLTHQLQQWFPQHGRHDLPWRQAHSAYEVWVSEIMLQQTQVSRVIPYYERFLERFPTVETLAATPWEEFLPYYAGLGYYRRGRNMLTTAQFVVEKHHGQFPADKAALLALPGIGEYTARAILSFGFGKAHLAFDTNQQRVFGRYLEGNKKASLDVTDISHSLPSDTDYAALNSALMDFANLVCTNRNPRCHECPLQPQCRYAQTGGEFEEQITRAKSRFPKTTAHAIVFLHENHQQYFSSQKQQYQPFKLPIGLTTRAQIKGYFRQKYDLELAVRPPFAKGYLDEQPVLLVNAQILLGTPEFAVVPAAPAKQHRQELLANITPHE